MDTLKENISKGNDVALCSPFADSSKLDLIPLCCSKVMDLRPSHSACSFRNRPFKSPGALLITSKKYTQASHSLSSGNGQHQVTIRVQKRPRWGRISVEGIFVIHGVVTLLTIVNLLTSYPPVMTRMRGVTRCSMVMIFWLGIG